MSKKVMLIALSIALVAALVGGVTMAWFTDSATAGEAEFTAGTVKITAGGSMTVSEEMGGIVEYEVEGGEFYPAYVVDYKQGTRKNGTSVLPERSDPNAVLQKGGFFSLGFISGQTEGGWITVKFEYPIQRGEEFDVITVTEETSGLNYPEEKVKVYVSQDGSSWTYVDEASNRDNPDGQQAFSTFQIPSDLEWAQYVKLVDITDPRPHKGDADGYDVVSVVAKNRIKSEVINWNPGNCNKVNYYVRNVGTKDIRVRAILTGQWSSPVIDDNGNIIGWEPWDEPIEDEQGNPYPPNAGVSLSICQEYQDKWTLIYDEENDEYVVYYNGELEGSYFGYGEGTDLCVKVCLNGPDTGNEYQGKRYRQLLRPFKLHMAPALTGGTGSPDLVIR
jgi:predicted ribosomally synthesized peptide with SipW-like signal peptide